ncbi:twitching motility two-component system response regulator PilH [Allochromatium warmingii]|uniref:Twitching motility two-component system response regulator PilH n=2 Tax=Allochromatium warmingii TaxID=61595 RepID=A0A1H3IFC2_ALLWA|nr:twitching motility two-component system response regulator PilH [Allochromatium warmingii]
MDIQPALAEHLIIMTRRPDTPPTVLIVDDSPTETHILATILKKAGYQVETASNGEEGVAQARALRPDIILMDVIMPVLNGYQATRLLRREADTADIPIIMVTTKDLQTDRTWGLRQGATDYLTKPVDRQLLLDRIRELLDSGAAHG